MTQTHFNGKSKIASKLRPSDSVAPFPRQDARAGRTRSWTFFPRRLSDRVRVLSLRPPWAHLVGYAELSRAKQASKDSGGAKKCEKTEAEREFLAILEKNLFLEQRHEEDWVRTVTGASSERASKRRNMSRARTHHLSRVD